MFGIIKYFIKLIQFAIAMIVIVVVLMYVTGKYVKWREVHAVPVYVERSEEIFRQIPERIIKSVNQIEGSNSVLPSLIPVVEVMSIDNSSITNLLKTKKGEEADLAARSYNENLNALEGIQKRLGNID